MKALTCPNCGSPLEYEANVAVLECYYCKQHIMLASRTLTREPAQGSTHAPQKQKKKKRGGGGGNKANAENNPQRALIVAGVIAVPVIAAGAFFAIRHESGSSAASAPSSANVLRSLELSASRDDAAKLLGAPPVGATTNQLTQDFQAGPVRRVEVQWDAQDKAHASSITLYLSAAGADAKATVAKLRTIIPHRVEPQGAGYRIKMGDSVLDVQDATIKVWHWTSVHPAGADYASCGTRRSAMWAAARFAALDGRALTAAELEQVNGPPLEAVARLELSLAVERVSDEFPKTFPAGRCWSQAGVLCQTDVDHALVSDVRWRWPNAVKGQVREARFAFWPKTDANKVQRAVAGCIQSALGPGEESVVDYVKGTRTWTFKIGKAGDIATLSERELVLSEAPSSKPDAPAEWPSRFAALITALNRCAL